MGMDAARKEKLGRKWACYSCEAKFYDLNKPEPICPRCQADQRESPAFEKPKRKKAKRAKKAAKKVAKKVVKPPPEEEEAIADSDASYDEIDLDDIDSPDLEVGKDDD